MTAGVASAYARRARTNARAIIVSEALPYATLTAAALVLRLVALDHKPLHHDEAIHAWLAWNVFRENAVDYGYDPTYHGPVQLFAMASVYLVAGVSELTARIAPALVGTLVVALPFALRDQLGRRAALAAAALLAVSPALLYQSRFAREDIYAACVTLALIAATFRFLERPRPWHPSLILGLIAVSFATKETTYITIALAGAFFLAVLALDVRRTRNEGRRAVEARLVTAVRAPGLAAWLWGFATFVGVFALLFSTFLLNPDGIRAGLVDSWRYWLSQHPVARGGQPRFFYVVLLAGYEWLALVLGAIGAVVALRRPTVLRVFLLWFFVGSLVAYTFAGERMPWLVVHPLLPLILLAGVGAETLWSARGRLAGRVGLGVAAAAAAYTIYASIGLSYIRPADPAEIMVFTQTSTDVPPLRDAFLAQHARATVERPFELAIDSWGGHAWPWVWYLRDLPVAYVDMSGRDEITARTFVVAQENRAARQRPGYRRRRFRLRSWWIPDYRGANVGDWAKWLLLRRPWNERGSSFQWVYTRRG